VQPTKWSTIAVTVVVSGVVAWAGLDLTASRAARFTQVPWTVPAALVVVAVVVVLLAWPVRQYVKGKRRQVDRLRAATVVALGKACTLAGSALSGLYGAVTLTLMAKVIDGAPGRWAWQAGAALLGAIVLTVGGRLTEWFCQLPPSEGPPETQPDGSHPQAA